MSIELLALLFVSPLIFYSFHLLIDESRDSLKGFHEEFAMTRFNQSKLKPVNESDTEAKKTALLQEVFSKKKIELIFGALLVVFSVYLGAGMKISIVLISVLAFYLYWEIGAASRKKAKRDIKIELELPYIAELFAILVSSGASPAVALLDISNISHGEFSLFLNKVRVELGNGGNLREALETISKKNSSLAVRRFCDSLIIAIERGTPLSDVLSRQVEELRNSQKAALIRQASRVEISLMIPVVFLILPISILFALWPSYVALGISVG